jgi:predicted outer membrane protein
MTISLPAFSLLATLTVASSALAADGPPTAEVLGKVHRSNLKEIEMGKMARAHGKAKDVKVFGQTLVTDHTAGDKKVVQLAKEEKIDLATSTPAATKDDKMPMGDGFDVAFANSMLADHKKDIEAVKAARDATQDQKLKSLLEDLLPVLEKHREISEKLVNGAKS